MGQVRDGGNGVGGTGCGGMGVCQARLDGDKGRQDRVGMNGWDRLGMVGMG